MCSLKRLCGKIECEVCFNRSFASYQGKTKKGKLKIECWDYDKNDKTPREVLKGTHKKYYFRCDICFHSFESVLYSITGKNSTWCSYCSNKILCQEECEVCFNKSFASYQGKTKKGKLKVECWDYEKNDKTPREVFKGYDKKYYFRCDICFHSFESRLYSISGKNESWCPYCDNKIMCQEECEVCFNKSFASYQGKTEKGKLKIECWDYDKNDKTPREVFKGTAKKHYFKCDTCFHSFDAVLKRITGNNPSWCPYCAGQIMCQEKKCDHCFNKSFASYQGRTEKGKLKVECWDYKKNDKTPREVFKGNGKKYHFKCDTCLHTFESVLYIITSKNPAWCPYCNNKTEKKFLNWLQKKYTNTKISYQPKYDWCKNEKTDRFLPFDFSIEEFKLIIEIDGRQHFEKVSNWQSPEFIQERDLLKMKLAKENGYTVIRIFQEDIYSDKNDWEVKTEEVIKRYEKPSLICIGDSKIYKLFNN